MYDGERWTDRKNLMMYALVLMKLFENGCMKDDEDRRCRLYILSKKLKL